MDRPALLGGQPLFPLGPPDWPLVDPAIEAALLQSIRDRTWGKYESGHVAALIERLRHWTGSPHVLTCASGTLAVEIALRALRIDSGEVVLAAYDYPGNFLSVHAVGAVPILADVNSSDWNLSLEALAASLGEQTRAVIVSHLHGGLVPMREVMEVCSPRGIAVIEDAAQAPGAVVQGRLAGTWGDVGILSFGGSKLLAAGRGGAILSRRADVIQRAKLLLSRGNNLLSPLSELQALVLLPQLDQLDPRNQRRLANVTRLGELLRDVPGLTPFTSSVEGVPAFYKLGFQFDETAFGLSRSRFVAALRAEGVAFDEGFRALHLGRAKNRWSARTPLLEAERAHRDCVILHHPILLGDDNDLQRLARAVHRVQAYADQLSK